MTRKPVSGPRTRALQALLLILLGGALGVAVYAPASSQSQPYVFDKGYPTPETTRRVYDEADLNRAIQAYRFFYPSVSMYSGWKGNLAAGMVPNQVFAALQGTPKKQVFTANSDTPYAVMPLDLSTGPMVVELPPGAIMSVVNDLNQRWVMDLGLPGPDKGQGGKHLVLPPSYSGGVPAGYFTGTSSTHRAMLMLRALAKGGDVQAAIALMHTVKVYPLNRPADWKEPRWISLTGEALDFSSLQVDGRLDYWKRLHELIDSEPALADYRLYYGELAALGIAKGKPFAPDARMRGILEQAAHMGDAQLRVQSLADRRPDRVVWPGRQWEWASLRPENGTFDTPDYVDLDAREKWFYQAVLQSPAMFRRTPGAGSLYWMSSHDAKGAYLDGGKTYRLRVPQPLPERLFWSVTLYDSQTRSQVSTDQQQAALRSLYELKDLPKDGPAELYFGPTAPPGKEHQWIKTQAGRGWFAYLRIYGPTEGAFDGSWMPSDFESVD
ncbi:DUF1254 domain-containing protein [Pseudomonas nitroreducens]|uniref:DUF1254 domain-containing protein n=1 Tax=Pseudomonas nitroreducens TaxID=46680 RepID=UPI003CC8292A